MNSQDFEKKQFIVANALGIEITTDFLSPDYALSEIKQDATTEKTGRLQLFRIEPTCARRPAFMVRIGHDDHQAVDIDLIGDKADRVAFATEAPGYVGHKTDDLATNPRSYHLEIKVPSVGHVFSGTVSIKAVGLGIRVGIESFGRNDGRRHDSQKITRGCADHE